MESLATPRKTNRIAYRKKCLFFHVSVRYGGKKRGFSNMHQSSLPLLYSLGGEHVILGFFFFFSAKHFLGFSPPGPWNFPLFSLSFSLSLSFNFCASGRDETKSAPFHPRHPPEQKQKTKMCSPLPLPYSSMHPHPPSALRR